MRVIAGQYRGRNLKSPPSMEVRPTSDRLRETLFNILQMRVDGARFLDLCAGSGAVGVEALSRGASHATFVDRSRKSCGLVEANLDLCGVPEEITEVVLSDAAEFVRRRAEMNGRAGGVAASWDIVFYDPPYSSDYAQVLGTFGLNGDCLLSPEGVFVAEHHHKTQLPEAIGGLRRWRIVKQGDASLSFYEHS
jgi:16S rRNA (guanine(966)-N(2))-methyltransferase RsmD